MGAYDLYVNLNYGGGDTPPLVRQPLTKGSGAGLVILTENMDAKIGI